MAAEVVATPVGSALQAVHSEYSAWPVGIEKAVHWEVRGHRWQVKRVRRAAGLMAQQARMLAVARVARSALRAIGAAGCAGGCEVLAVGGGGGGAVHAGGLLCPTRAPTVERGLAFEVNVGHDRRRSERLRRVRRFDLRRRARHRALTTAHLVVIVINLSPRHGGAAHRHVEIRHRDAIARLVARHVGAGSILHGELHCLADPDAQWIGRRQRHRPGARRVLRQRSADRDEPKDRR